MLVPSALTQLTWSLRVDSVDVVSHLALTQFTGSLTPHLLSLRGVSLRIDSVYGESHSALTHWAEDGSSHNRHTVYNQL
jgi:hypothetical protein